MLISKSVFCELLYSNAPCELLLYSNAPCELYSDNILPIGIPNQLHKIIEYKILLGILPPLPPYISTSSSFGNTSASNVLI